MPTPISTGYHRHNLTPVALGVLRLTWPTVHIPRSVTGSTQEMPTVIGFRAVFKIEQEP